MTPERWREVKPMLAAALELNPAERSAFLDLACGGDQTLRDEVNRLLHAEAQAGPQFLADPLALDNMPALVRELNDWTGRRVGAYRLEELIGAGGMGEVYRAVRADDQYRTEVAIKLVRGAPGSTFVSQFRVERQILADLNHPNIARLLDGGTAEERLPYLVMELVDGTPIDVYCEAHQVAISDRLTLFLQVCAAVQYAHQRLIVHRDLKPTNILVTAAGVPKLLDFGVAKLLHEGADPSARDVTVSGHRFLTPEYASPEQIRAEPVTTATDVYSLGMILYRLLTRQSPYRPLTQAPHELARVICDEEPERPSVAVRRPPRGSRVDEERERKLSRQLAGDLDMILLKALRKEPARRYGSVEQLAEDIRRHRANLPVLARRDTIAYRSAKFVRRHAVGVSVAGLMLLAVSTAVAVTLRSAAVARAERARAEQRFNDLRQLARSNLFELNDTIGRLPGSAAARNLVIQRALQYLDKLNSESGGRRDLLEELAVGYGRIAKLQGHFSGPGIGDLRADLTSYAKALAIRENLAAQRPSDATALGALGDIARAYTLELLAAGQTAEATRVARRALSAFEQAARLEPGDARVLMGEALAHERMANVMGGVGSSNSTRQLSEAIAHDRQGLAILARVPGDNETRAGREAELRLRLAFHLQKARAFDESARTFDAILGDEARRALPPAVAIVAYNRHGLMFERAGDQRRALGEYENYLRLASPAAEADPDDLNARIDLAIAQGHVGMQMARLGRPRAGLLLDASVRVFERQLEADPRSLYANLLVVGYAYQAEMLSGLSDQRAAESKLRTALTLATNVSRSDPEDLESPLTIAKLHASLAVALARAARYGDARRECDAARERIRDVLQLRPDDAEAAYTAQLAADDAEALSACADGRRCRGAARLRFPTIVN
jgi:non-specific serine/threonine protein kinase/serine/threonine-protein kinase